MSSEPIAGDEEQIAALRALAEGRLAAWPGLPPGCGRRHVEAALGPSEPGPDGAGQLGGSPTAFRHYPSAPIAPYGIVVWYVGDQVTLIEINTPSLPASPEAQLGPPEARARSGLDGLHTQLVYAGRGLTIHQHELNGSLKRIYAYAPTSAEAFLQSWLGQVAIERRRRP
jgi:hypothetical protein